MLHHNAYSALGWESVFSIGRCIDICGTPGPNHQLRQLQIILNCFKFRTNFSINLFV